MNKEICVFCGKSNEEVGRIISNGKVGICDRCVYLCTWVLEEELGAVEYTKQRYEMRYELDKEER